MTFDYRNRQQKAQEAAEIPPEIPRQSLLEWVTDICKCRECRDGFVSFEVNGYDTLFACPVCDRYKRELRGFQAIPSAKKWMGSYTTYSDADMEKMIEDRRVVAESIRRGSSRAPVIPTGNIGGVEWLDK